MADYPTTPRSASTPAQPTISEQATHLVRAGVLACQLENTINDLDGFLQALHLDSREWPIYREFMDAAWLMHSALRFLGSDDGQVYATHADAVAHLTATGWGDAGAQRSDEREKSALLATLEAIPRDELPDGLARDTLAYAITIGYVDNLYRPLGHDYWNLNWAHAAPSEDPRERVADWAQRAHLGLEPPRRKGEKDNKGDATNA